MKYFFSSLSLVLITFIVYGQKAPSVTHGTAEQSSVVNFKEIAAYELLNPPTLDPRRYIMHESENEESIPGNFYTPDAAPMIYDTVPFFEGRSGMPYSPPPTHNFTGLNDINGGIPPDVGGAVGPNHVMEVLNTQVRIYTRAGTAVYTASLNGYWSSLGNPSTFDPKVYYDDYADRWIFVTIADAQTANARILLGVTETNDPTGTWRLYSIDVDASNVTWFDYPSVGYNNKWICINGNMFNNTSNNFTGSQIYNFDKATLYATGPANYTRFTGSLFTACPAQTHSATQDTMFLLQNLSSTQLRIYRITGPVGSEAFATHATVTSSAWGCSNCQGNFAPQRNTDSLVDCGDYRMRSAIYRNGSIWAAHTVFLPATGRTRALVQWWQISTSGTVIQKGRIEDPSSNIFYTYPDIAVNAAGDAFISYCRLGYNDYPTAEYALRMSGDPLNTMRDGYRYKIGEAWYAKDFGSGRNRWGDYTEACVDPLNDTCFWALSEYAKSPTSTWATWIAEVCPYRTNWVDFVADTTIACSGIPIQFTDQTNYAASSWAWTFAGGTPATSTLQNPVVTFASAGVKNVSLVVNGNDTMVKNNYILVLSVPVTTVATSGPTTFCQGGSVNLTASITGVSWQWFPTGQTTRTITVTQSGTYYCILTNAGGCTATSQSVTVTVNPLPTVTLSPFSNVCNDDPAFALTGGSPSGGTYSGTAVTGGMFNPAVAGPGTFAITYSYTDGNNCTNTAVQNIVVDNCTGVPIVTASYSLSVKPIPAHSTLDINFIPKAVTGILIDLTNELGQKVFEKNAGRSASYNETIDVSTLPPGIYFLNIHTDKETAKMKVIIE
jgi:PKD repeat protein